MWGGRTGSEEMQQAYANNLYDSDSTISFGNSYVFLYFANADSSSYSVTYQYVLTRDYPAGGVMPAVSFGSVVQRSSIPSALTGFVPIEITNTQGQSISTGFQQQLSINWNNYKSFLNQYAENIEFYDSSWNTLNAWIESGAFNPTVTSTVWLKLDQLIPADNSITVYLGFLPTSQSQYGQSVGIAPQLTGSYGYFDTGKNVFSFYDNFCGNHSQFAVDLIAKRLRDRQQWHYNQARWSQLESCYLQHIYLWSERS
jgi:hypothetical protein